MLGCLVILSGCSDSTSEIVSKAKSATTTRQLIDAIGRPDRVEKHGSLFYWYYDATDGRVQFLIQGGQVSLGDVNTEKPEK